LATEDRVSGTVGCSLLSVSCSLSPLVNLTGRVYTETGLLWLS